MSVSPRETQGRGQSPNPLTTRFPSNRRLVTNAGAMLRSKPVSRREENASQKNIPGWQRRGNSTSRSPTHTSESMGRGASGRVTPGGAMASVNVNSVQTVKPRQIQAKQDPCKTNNTEGEGMWQGEAKVRGESNISGTCNTSGTCKGEEGTKGEVDGWSNNPHYAMQVSQTSDTQH